MRIDADLAVANNAAICSAIDFEIVVFDGAKFEEMPDVVGAGSEQFTAQHNRATSAIGE